MSEEKSKREILIDSILERTNKYTREQLEELLDLKEKQVLELVLRQTDLEREKAIELLKENDYDSIKVIKQYMGIKEKKEKKEVSVNQQVYREIRGFMDNASKQYRFSKELEKKREEMMEFLKEKEKEKEKEERNQLKTIEEKIEDDN